MHEVLPRWQQLYKELAREMSPAALRQLASQLGGAGAAYGLSKERVEGVAYFSLLLCSPEQRATLAPYLGYRILWIYALDGFTDNCSGLDELADLQLVTAAILGQQAGEPTTILNSRLLKSNPQLVPPAAGCSLATLAHSLAALLLQQPHRGQALSSQQWVLLAAQIRAEVAATAQEGAWRLQRRWQQLTVREYMAVAEISIGVRLITAFLLSEVADGLAIWPQALPAIAQAATICRLANDLATAAREVKEGGANILFLLLGSDAERASVIGSHIATAADRLEAELALLSGSPATFLAGTLRRMCAITLALYRHNDFLVPTA